MVCAKNKPAVSGLEAEFPGKVKARNVESTSAEGEKAVRENGFKSHGLVIRSAEGRVVWTQADHAVKIEDVRAAIKALLKD